jgi:carboxylesterase type B
VTVFGESAGAILISLLYLQPDIALFKGAIMESGAQSTAPIGPTGTTWQGPYDLLVEYAGCSGNASANSTSASNASSFDCLKALPADQILAAQEKVKQIPQYSLASVKVPHSRVRTDSSFVFAPTIDGDIIPDSPHSLLAEGQFAKIPYISGNMKDEWVDLSGPRAR